jgi:lipopolysaccharide transport system ATP-binding protein
MSDIVINVENLGKQYRLGNVGTGTLTDDIKRWWYLARGKEDPFLKIGEVNDRALKGTSDYIWALRDINLQVQQGEVLGIIGKNGAGKSTLLKILSKITAPTIGKIGYKGRIGSLLEVGTGFHQDLTGRENIFINGAILGMTKKEIAKKFDKIVDFSGCERYIDTPVKRYSSGMLVRLGFAVAAFLEPEILVVDEVLAVGDSEFQSKAIGKMKDVSRNDGRTVLFVSHNMGSLSQLCSKGILLKNGTLAYHGDIQSTIEEYSRTIENESRYLFERSSENQLPIFIERVQIFDDKDRLTGTFDTNSKIKVKLDIVNRGTLSNVDVLFTILDKYKKRICSINKHVTRENGLTVIINPNFLVRGDYSFMTHVYQPGSSAIDVLEDICPINILDAGTQLAHLETFDYGCVFGNMYWED